MQDVTGVYLSNENSDKWFGESRYHKRKDLAGS
jgi:hypothetical protein